MYTTDPTEIERFAGLVKLAKEQPRILVLFRNRLRPPVAGVFIGSKEESRPGKHPKAWEYAASITVADAPPGDAYRDQVIDLLDVESIVGLSRDPSEDAEVIRLLVT